VLLLHADSLTEGANSTALVAIRAQIIGV